MSSKAFPAVFLMAAFLTLTACGDDLDDPMGGVSGSPAPAMANPNSLSSITNEIFIPSCALATCHGTGMLGMLDLAVNPHLSLVGVQSPVAVGQVRVIAGNSLGSYLIKKLESDSNTDMTVVGARMPSGGTPLDALAVGRIKAWIDNGALND